MYGRLVALLDEFSRIRKSRKETYRPQTATHTAQP